MATRIKLYNNRTLASIFKHFKEATNVAASKEVEVIEDTETEWAVHVSPKVEFAWKSAVIAIHGAGRYDRTWTSADTGIPEKLLYCSYKEEKKPAVDYSLTPYFINAVFYSCGEPVTPYPVATVRLFTVVGSKEAEKYVEHYDAGIIPDAENAVIHGTIALLKRLYSDITYSIQKELVK